VGPHQFAQLFGESENQVEVPGREQPITAFIEPLESVLPAAPRAVAVAAGMVGIVLRFALCTLADMSSESLRAAIGDVAEGTPVAWHHAALKPLQVPRAEKPEDLCKLGHGRRPEYQWLHLRHHGVYGDMEPVYGLLREMGIEGSRLGALVPEDLLDGSNIDAVLQKIGGVRMTQRMDSGILLDGAFAHHRFEGLLERGLTKRAFPVLWE
jgi:hypothetical protein